MKMIILFFKCVIFPYMENKITFKLDVTHFAVFCCTFVPNAWLWLCFFNFEKIADIFICHVNNK